MSEESAAPADPSSAPLTHEGGIPSSFEGISLSDAASALTDAYAANRAAEAPAANEGGFAPPAPAAAPAAPVVDPLEVRVAEFVERQAAARRELETERASISGHRAEVERLTAMLAERDSKLAKLRTSPLEVLGAEGWDVESLNRAALTEKTPESVRMTQLEDRLNKALAAAEDSRKAADAASVAANTARAVAAVKDEIGRHASASATTMPHVVALLEPAEIMDAAYDIMSSAWRDSNGTRRLSPADALGMLETQLSARAKRLQVTNPPAPPPAVPTSRPTLSNSATASNPNHAAFEDLNISDSELNSRAAALLTFKSRGK